MGTRIELCGQLAVEIEGTRIEGSLRGRQGRLLLAYLVLNRHRPVRRDELVEALWSDGGPPEGGEVLLAPPLSRLRRALGDGRLAGRAELRLVLPGDAWVDWEAARAGVASARAALASGDAAAAFAATGEPLEVAERGLLPGLEAAWIDVRRAELGDLRLEALEVRAAAGAAMGGAEQNEAERAARAAVEAAPFRESSRAALMQVLHARGNVAARGLLARLDLAGADDGEGHACGRRRPCLRAPAHLGEQARLAEPAAVAYPGAPTPRAAPRSSGPHARGAPASGPYTGPEGAAVSRPGRVLRAPRSRCSPRWTCCSTTAG